MKLRYVIKLVVYFKTLDDKVIDSSSELGLRYNIDFHLINFTQKNVLRLCSNGNVEENKRTGATAALDFSENRKILPHSRESSFEQKRKTKASPFPTVKCSRLEYFANKASDSADKRSSRCI